VTDIARVGVIGCGLMGAGIAEICARAGIEVSVYDVSQGALDVGRDRVVASFARAVRNEKISAADRDEALGRITFTTVLEDFADRDLTIEAIIERQQDKIDLFERLDQIVTRPDAILATNTSSIPIMPIAMATKRPEQVVGIHFFNPPTVLDLVEVIPTLVTSATTEERARALVADVLGKTPIRAPDQAGFVVNALLIPFLLSAIRMTAAGLASVEDIDTGLVKGCAHPMGPLRLADLIGLDTLKSAASAMYEEFKEPLYAPPPLLLRMVEAGQLGKKTGRGFYDYTS
jgi:3-hydroxybutyryl-CoA dehydrogenase